MQPKTAPVLEQKRQDPRTVARRFLAIGGIVLDTETTGLGHLDQLVEIACVDAEGAVLLDTMIRPGTAIRPEAQRIHGITEEMVSDAPTMKVVAPLLRRTIEGRPIASYNLPFDMKMLQRSLLANGQLTPPAGLASADCLCIMSLYTGYVSSNQGRPADRGPRAHTSLANALAQCQLEPPAPAHQALGDAQAALRLLRHIAAS